jgi:hypothetical protein
MAMGAPDSSHSLFLIQLLMLSLPLFSIKLNIMSQNRTKHNLTIVIYNLARGNRNMDVQII